MILTLRRMILSPDEYRQLQNSLSDSGVQEYDAIINCTKSPEERMLEYKRLS